VKQILSVSSNVGDVHPIIIVCRNLPAVLSVWTPAQMWLACLQVCVHLNSIWIYLSGTLALLFAVYCFPMQWSHTPSLHPNGTIDLDANSDFYRVMAVNHHFLPTCKSSRSIFLEKIWCFLLSLCLKRNSTSVRSTPPFSGRCVIWGGPCRCNWVTGSTSFNLSELFNYHGTKRMLTLFFKCF